MIAARDQRRAKTDAEHKKLAKARSKRLDAKLKKALAVKPKRKPRRVT